MSVDPVRRYLAERGCPDFVVAGGIEGLVAGWERTAVEVREGYAATLDEYLNDLDARQIIEDVLSRFPEPDGVLIDRLRAADELFVAITTPVETCLWGERDAAAHAWSARENWWYFRVPRELGDILGQDLEGRPARPGPDSGGDPAPA